MKSRLKTTTCPACGYPITASTAIGSPPVEPQPGDASICLACASLLIFTVDLGLREPSPEEKAEWLAHYEVRRAIEGIIVLRDHDPEWPHGPGRPA